MGSRQRYVIVGILLIAALLGISLSHGLGWIWAQGGLDDLPIVGRDFTLTTALAYALAIGAAVFAIKHAYTFQLASEVVDEMSKVSWPTREETFAATGVVLVTVIVCSLYLGIFDAMWLSLTNWILGVQRG